MTKFYKEKLEAGFIVGRLLGIPVIKFAAPPGMIAFEQSIKDWDEYEKTEDYPKAKAVNDKILNSYYNATIRREKLETMELPKEEFEFIKQYLEKSDCKFRGQPLGPSFLLYGIIIYAG